MAQTVSKRLRRERPGLVGRITYNVDVDQHVVLESWNGEISLAALRSHWTACLSDPEVLAVKRTVADLRHCEITFSGKEWLNELETFVIGRQAFNGWHCAIVVSQTYIYGIARQYLSYTAGPITGEIFYSDDGAFEWIGKLDNSD